MGYSIRTGHWCYTEWRDFKTGRIVGQELYDEDTDPKQTANLAGTVAAAPHIPSLAAQLDAMVKSAKPTARVAQSLPEHGPTVERTP